MRVLVCPDSFTGTLSAAEAAEAIAAGWSEAAPADELIQRPLSDGGPGFVTAIEGGLGGRRRSVRVSGPLGEPVDAEYLLTGTPPFDDPGAGVVRAAWIESASAAGLHLVPEDRRDPTRTTSLGVGQLIADALASGASRIVLGVGGTGTSDGGAGLLAGLGARCAQGDLTSGGGSLGDVDGLELSAALTATAETTIEVATDVDVPLLGPRGAARGFAPQKGATAEQVDQLEEALRLWAHQLGRTDDGRAPAVALGAGAGGGIGAALLRLGARRVAGIATVLEASGVDALLDAQPREVDLVVTGEGSFDWQSLRGKLITTVAAGAAERGLPCVVLAGRVSVGRREAAAAGVEAAYSVSEHAGSVEASMADPAGTLAALAEQVARHWGG